MSELGAKKDGEELRADVVKAIKLAANYFITEVRKHLSETGKSIGEFIVTPENFAEFVVVVTDGTINSSAAQTVLAEMYRGEDNDPSHIIERLNLAQMSDTGELEAVVDAILAANAQSVADFKAGKQNALQYLVGQVMKETKGKANPGVAKELLEKKLTA